MKNVKVLTTAILLGMGLMMGGCGSQQDTPHLVQQEQQQKTPTDVAYEKFINIKMHSSYDQVKQILGVEGKPTASNTIDSLTTEGYDFNVNGVSIHLIFQNGELSMKHINSGYKSSKKVTLEKYNKVRVGMTYDQVKQIFECEGFLNSVQQYSSGTKFVFVMWRNASGSFATIQFDGDGNVIGKVQAGLQ